MSGPGLNFSIKNSLYHKFLYHYFRQAFYVYSILKSDDLKENFSLLDIARQKITFDSIFRKICGSTTEEPSILNDASKFFNIQSPYPLKVNLNQDEKFWFEYIINMNCNEVFELLENDHVNTVNPFIFQIEVKNGMREMLKTFKTIDSVEYLRLKIIKEENFENSPLKVGFK